MLLLILNILEGKMFSPIYFVVFCFIFNTCQSSSHYGVTNHYIEVDGNTPGAETCYKAPNCDSTCKYRTADGSCNNLNYPAWGTATTSYLRLLPAEYQDGYKEFRKAKDGSELPNVRLISTTLYPDVYVGDKLNSLALVLWGQAVSHDSAATSFPVILDCCPNGQFAQPPNPQCYPIKVPANDPFYSKYNVTCMTFIRSDTTESNQQCLLKPQQQYSCVTHWLDLSLLYGIDDDAVKSIREMKGGQLKVERVNGVITMPLTHEKQILCRIESSNQSCLSNTGDLRVNQNPGLAVLTIVFLKEHNVIADQLAKINPAWTDEKLYQEARRINAAQFQHITYSEYLPHILAQPYIEGMKLASLNKGYTEYNAKIRGGTINEFTGSIFRIFHSTVQGDLKLIGGGSGSCPMKTAALSDYFWKTGDLVNQCFEQLSKGLLGQEARIYNNYVTAQMTEYFQKGNKPYGDDVESVSLMRGRDAGLQSYNKYRKICDLRTFSNFQELNSVMSHKVVEKLQKLYKSVDDIDLYLGVILENPVSPGLTGPLAQCIMAQQFGRYKYGDRFYYEHKDQTGSFTKEQLEEIRKVTFSSLMCRNTNIGKVQRKGFYKASISNREVSCNEIHSLDLKEWKD